MKKFLAVLLALTCAFAMFACNEEETPCTTHIDEDKNNLCDVCGADVTPVEDPTPVNNYRTDAVAFINALDTTVVENIRVEVTVKIEGDAYTSTYTTVYDDDGSAEMTYKIAKVPGVDSALDVEYDEGKVQNPADGSIGVTGIKLNLKSDRIENYTVNGNILTISLSAADASAVVGYSVPADATLVVTKADNQIVSMTLTYADTVIVCSYNIA